MEQLKVLMDSVDIMNQTDSVLDTVDGLVKESESHGSVSKDIGRSSAGDAPVSVFPCMECNDGERAILSSYVSLMRQCIELAEKVGAAKA